MLRMIRHLLIVLGLLFSGTVMALFGDDEDVITQTSLNLYFKYTPQDSKQFGNNDHPVRLEAKTIGLALKALQFTEKRFLSGAQTRGVFSTTQIRKLGKYLAEGLESAQPQQDIVFVMEGGRSKLILLNEKNFVAGRVFYQQGKLNIILGEYDRARNDAFESVYDPSGRAAVPYSFDHGRRSKSSGQFEWAIDRIDGFSQKEMDGKLRQDWLVLDLTEVARGYVEREKQAQNQNQDRTQSVVDQEVALRSVNSSLARERRGIRADMARMRKEMHAIQSAGKGSAISVEERMATLARLRDKELITEQEYEAKRQVILDEI